MIMIGDHRCSERYVLVSLVVTKRILRLPQSLHGRKDAGHITVYEQVIYLVT